MSFAGASDPVLGRNSIAGLELLASPPAPQTSTAPLYTHAYNLGINGALLRTVKPGVDAFMVGSPGSGPSSSGAFSATGAAGGSSGLGGSGAGGGGGGGAGGGGGGASLQKSALNQRGLFDPPMPHSGVLPAVLPPSLPGSGVPSFPPVDDPGSGPLPPSSPSVPAIPLPSAFPMLAMAVIGLGGIGYAGKFRGRRRAATGRSSMLHGMIERVSQGVLRVPQQGEELK